MKEVALIYPHQLHDQSPVIQAGRTIVIVEEPLLLTHNPAHRSRLILHKLAMDAFQKRSENQQHNVIRLKISELPTTQLVFEHLRSRGVEIMHIADTTDQYLEGAIERSGLRRIWYESPSFILGKEEAETRFLKSKRFMASFYKQLRIDRAILMNPDQTPMGGKWSFDEDNRKKIPKNYLLPNDITLLQSPAIDSARRWVDSLQVESYGEANFWLPHTHEGAVEYLEEFLEVRFSQFGAYEDAMTTRGVRLWHSTLSPLINIGLLTPKQVLDAALVHARDHDVPPNSLEGFVRQILGWREFIRASYEVDGVKMRNSNFWRHETKLSSDFWEGTTGIEPVDHAIKSALAYGYTHHIERLMVMGNFMLLARIHPHEVYRWFMGMYIDAYDWVMVPNVYGMSQFADGGSFATKPYISGANYIKKMSDYAAGDWENQWTALYWKFIQDHLEVFQKNHRLSMMPQMLKRMSEDKRAAHFALADKFLTAHPG